MNKRIRTSIISAALVGGSILGVAQVGGVANAQTDDEPVPTEQTEDPPADGETDRPGRHRGMGGALDAIAEVIGVEADEIRTQVRDGATLGDIAEANGVDSTEVVAVIVESKQDRLAQAVEDGRITQEEADERVVDLEDRVTTRVDEGRPERPEGEAGEGRQGRRGGNGPGGAGADAPADAPAPADG